MLQIRFLPAALLITMIISFLFLSISAQAQRSLIDNILEENTIRVGTTGDYIPFSYVENGDLIGIDIELAKDLANSLGVDLVLVNTTWPTLMDDLHQDKFDISMSGISINLERQKTALFSIPILSGGKVAITRDENVSKFKTLALINRPEVRVIFNPGGTNETFARTNFPNANLIENEDNISIFQKIVDGEVDVMVTDAIETIVQQEVHPELEAVNYDKPFNYSEKGYLFKRDIIFKAFIDQWINMRLNDGTFNKVHDEQIGKYVNSNN